MAVAGEDVFRFHWHPLGDSPVKYPHVHANLAPSERLKPSLDAHLVTDRMSIERALGWAFEPGLPSARDDWPNLLANSEHGLREIVELRLEAWLLGRAGLLWPRVS